MLQFVRVLLALGAVLIVASGVVKKPKYDGYTVHVVFSNHLDVGFTDLDSNVINLYFHKHFPAAIQLAADLSSSPDNTAGDVFRYTTHSWLLSFFLDCPPGMGIQCPDQQQVSAVKAAIAAGTITWHAAPFNPQYEVFDAGLLSSALDLTHDLDDEFNQPHKKMISLRDVPGLTRAAVPIFNQKGIKGLTSGVNGFSAPPGVPHNTPFLWRDQDSGTDVIAMWHPGGYSGSTYGLQVDSRRDCIQAHNLKHVLCVAWRNDNAGPPDSLGELLTMLRIIRQQWPGATVRTNSSLDDYLDHVITAVNNKQVKLPVVTGEIGDTWVHGIASDPGKMSDYRAALRAAAACRADQTCDHQSYEFKNFTRLLMKVAEHTWGVSFNWYFGDATNYTNTWLQHLLEDGEQQHHNLAVTLESWRRQRQYIDWALQALPEKHPVVEYVQTDREARRALVGVSDAAAVAAGARAVLKQAPAAAATAGLSSSSSSSSSSGVGRSSCADYAHLIRDADHVGDHDHQDLLFCSQHWLIQIDRQTGGLLRLQRIYKSIGSKTVFLGNNWAAAADAVDDADDNPNQQQQLRRLLKQKHTGEESLSRNPPHHQQQQQQQQSGSSSSSHSRQHHGPSFGQLQYDVYNLDDYSFVWDHYAYLHPVWVGDFGKWNMSATVNMSETAKPKLLDVYEHYDDDAGLTIKLKLTFSDKLIKHAGAPKTVWVVLHSPAAAASAAASASAAAAAAAASLSLSVVWQHKTPTRLPEALWLRFKPGKGAVDEASWVMNKIESCIKPTEVVVNGSHSIHAVGNKGISVDSKDGVERLSINTIDVPLVNAGRPNPFYNPSEGPDMSEGMSFNIVNNIWGTNYIMWVPYTSADEPGMAFRFVIEANQVATAVRDEEHCTTVTSQQ